MKMRLYFIANFQSISFTELVWPVWQSYAKVVIHLLVEGNIQGPLIYAVDAYTSVKHIS